MNPELIKEIKDRVRKVESERAGESILAAHLDAIAEVYGTDRETVESIARNVIAESGSTKKQIDFVKARNILWVSALVLIIISVIWLLYNNLQTSPRAESDDLTKSDRRTIGYVSQALASLNVVKVYVAEHVATIGKMPSSFNEIGVKESDLIATKYIDRIQMSKGGVVTVNLSNLIGNQRYLKMKPTLRIASYQVEWECSSNLKEVILDEINGCTPD